MEKEYGNLKYKVEEKSITIIGYTNEKIEMLEIPETIEQLPVTRIRAGAFRECDSLVDIKLPEGLIELAWRAFSGCSSLATVMLPQTLTELSFGGMVEVSTTIITMPEDWKDAVDWAFNGCISLVEVSVSKGTKGEKLVFENASLQFDKKQYIDKVMDGIKFDGKKKSEMRKYLEEIIDNDVRRGEPLERVLSQMGSTKALAKDFNERMYRNRKK